VASRRFCSGGGREGLRGRRRRWGGFGCTFWSVRVGFCVLFSWGSVGCEVLGEM
jgi:hypothetical protein